MSSVSVDEEELSTPARRASIEKGEKDKLYRNNTPVL